MISSSLHPRWLRAITVDRDMPVCLAISLPLAFVIVAIVTPLSSVNQYVTLNHTEAFLLQVFHLVVIRPASTNLPDIRLRLES